MWGPYSVYIILGSPHADHAWQLRTVSMAQKVSNILWVYVLAIANLFYFPQRQELWLWQWQRFKMCLTTLVQFVDLLSVWQCPGGAEGGSNQLPRFLSELTDSGQLWQSRGKSSLIMTESSNAGPHQLNSQLNSSRSRPALWLMLLIYFVVSFADINHAWALRAMNLHFHFLCCHALKVNFPRFV